MKHLLFVLAMTVMMASCSTPVTYKAYYDKTTETRVVLNKKNFRVLGHFQGESVVKKTTNFKRSEGMLAKAREDLIQHAEKAGYALSGSRMLVNVTVDYIETDGYIKTIMAADMIEFTE